MNSISAWNIFCQSMLANIDGETDYPELDYQFDHNSNSSGSIIKVS